MNNKSRPGLLKSLVLAAALLIPTSTPSKEVWPDSPWIMRFATQEENAKPRLFGSLGHRVTVASDSQLSALQSNPNNTLACAATYETFFRTLQRPGLDKHESSPDSSPELVFFLGFLAGRLRCELPDDWRNAVRLTRHDRDAISFSKSENMERLQFHDLGFDAQSPLWGIGNEGISVRENSITVALDDKSAVEFPRHEWSKTHNYIAVKRIDNLLFVAEYSYSKRRYPLSCYQLDDKKLRWQSLVLNARPPLFLGGSSDSGNGPIHFLQFRESQDAVFVFGFGEIVGYYVEGFDKKSGEMIFEFNSYYWKLKLSGAPAERFRD